MEAPGAAEMARGSARRAWAGEEAGDGRAGAGRPRRLERRLGPGARRYSRPVDTAQTSLIRLTSGKSSPLLNEAARQGRVDCRRESRDARGAPRRGGASARPPASQPTAAERSTSALREPERRGPRPAQRRPPPRPGRGRRGSSWRAGLPTPPDGVGPGQGLGGIERGTSSDLDPRVDHRFERLPWQVMASRAAARAWATGWARTRPPVRRSRPAPRATR